MKAPKLYIDKNVGHTVEENDEAARVAIFTIDEDTARRIILCAQLVIEHGFISVTTYDPRALWLTVDPGELESEIGDAAEVTDQERETFEMPSDVNRLEVMDYSFRFTAFAKFGDDRFYTEDFAIDELAQHFGLEAPKRPERLLAA